MPKKNLMIVESPAKAKTIEKYLGGDFVVKASYGHVRDLPKGDKAIDIDHGFTPVYEVLPDKKDVIKELKKLCKDSEVVWLATDEDREGEAISWHLAEVLGLDENNAKRVVFNEITKKAILKAIEQPRSIDQNLVNAQQARRVLDRLVGFQLSPVLWKKVRTGLSAGRVQSVAVRLIVEREREIIEFEAQSSFRVRAEFILDDGTRLLAELSERLSNEEEARSFLEECAASAFGITALETKPATKSPSAPFTTSTLQQEASRKLGFSVAQTMRLAQSLYEAGHITYMRTDSVNLSGDAIAQARDLIVNEFGEEYHQVRQYKNKNSSAQEAHEAIRPTNMTEKQAGGDRNEQRLYDLIRKRTIACQMAEARLEKTTATISVSESSRQLQARGEVLVFDGFLKVYLESRDEEPDDEENSGVLPPLSVGQQLKLDTVNARERFTRHAPRYTEASLVKKLEELGIGRPSTYAPTISTIQKRNYVVKDHRDGEERSYRVIRLQDGKIEATNGTEIVGAEKAKLFPTDLGILVTDFLTANFPRVLDYGFTAKVEAEFDEIAEGDKLWNQMIGDFYVTFHEKVEDTKENAERVSKDRELGVHPESGEPVIAKFGRYGPYIAIGDPESEKKPRYASLRSDQRLDTITMEEALELFKLPRVLAESEEGEQIRVNIGRFGPYVQRGKKFYSIPKGEDPLEVTLERALQIIKEKEEAEANKTIAELAEDVHVLNGRYGPYIKMRGKNIRIPKGVEPKEITLEMAEEYFAAHKDKPKRGRRK